MPIKNLSAHKYFFLALALGWTLLIAVLCLVSFNKMPSVSLQSADKYVHCIFHFVFTVLWYLHFRRINNGKWLLLKAFLCSLLYGGLIEIMQGLFTLTRKADLNDVAANSFGATLAVITLFFYSEYVKKKAL